MSSAASRRDFTGLYLASRLRSGAPWVGRDGVYDLESIAVVVIGGTLLAGGRGGVWGTLAGVLLFATLDATFNMLGVSAYPKLVLRGAIVVAAVAVYTVRTRGPCRMTVALQESRQTGLARSRRRSPDQCRGRRVSRPLSRRRPAAAELSRTGRA